MLMAAALASGRGLDAAACVNAAQQAREPLKLWFSVDTLEYLRRGGRIGGAAAWMGAALKIKPILSIDTEITPIERVRTSKRAFEAMVAVLEDCKQKGNDGWVIQHIQAPDQAAALVARGREIFGILMYTGLRIDSAEALRIGLVDRVIPDGKLWDQTLQVARTISGNAPLSIKASKLTIAQVLKDKDERDMAAIKAISTVCMDSEDFREGRQAFMEKRKPSFKGR